MPSIQLVYPLRHISRRRLANLHISQLSHRSQFKDMVPLANSTRKHQIAGSLAVGAGAEADGAKPTTNCWLASSNSGGGAG